MVRLKPQREEARAVVEPKGFDDFEVKLGDKMRGERATLGKSLLDVQRELRIKASYIAAIENCDASVFETPGFVAGYVRSYARYLKLDPEIAYERFCAESGFAVARGLSSDDQVKAKARNDTGKKRAKIVSDELFDGAKTPYAPTQSSAFVGIAPEAIGSSMILLAVIGLIAYGAWVVLQEIQKVSVAPVEQAPQIAMSLGPEYDTAQGNIGDEASLPAPTAEAFDRLYRPQALEVPVIVSRDAPIATLDPSTLGSFAPPTLEETAFAPLDLVAEDAIELAIEEAATPDPVVVEQAAPQVAVLAVQPAWVRVRASDGSVIFEKILAAGEEYLLPQLEEAPTLRAGNSGAVYFKVGSQIYGPAGGPGGVAKNVALSSASLSDAYSEADPTIDDDLLNYINLATAN